MGVETAPGTKGKAPQTAGKGGAATGPNASKNAAPNAPPVRQFANQLQQDIEDVTVVVNSTGYNQFLFFFFSFFFSFLISFTAPFQLGRVWSNCLVGIFP